MSQKMAIYVLSAVAVGALALAVSAWFSKFANTLDTGVAVYNGSSIVNMYWQYKSEHGHWPGPGEVFCYGDSRYIGTFSQEPSSGARCDVYTFSRTSEIVVEIAPQSVFARLQGPDSWDWQHITAKAVTTTGE